MSDKTYRHTTAPPFPFKTLSETLAEDRARAMAARRERACRWTTNLWLLAAASWALVAIVKAVKWLL